jgi:hypothetical protein
VRITTGFVCGASGDRSGTRLTATQLPEPCSSPHLRQGSVADTRRGRTALVLCLAAGLLGVFAWEASGQDARAIVAESQRLSQAESQRYHGSLRVVDNRGRIADKEWQFSRIGSHGRSRSVLRFVSPPEVRGVALLVVNHPDRASDQWMWTPAIARERRIAFQDRSTRFFGTDFSFEDLEERDVDQYDFRMLGDDVVDGAECWRIEARPKRTKASQYDRSRVWIRKDNYAFARVENDVKGQLARRLEYKDIRNVQGIWTAHVLEMTDIRRESTTILKLENLEYNVAMREDDFTLQALRRGQ